MKKDMELIPMPGLELAKEDYPTKLHYQRALKRVTQKQLSERSKIPLRTIQQWECGQRNIEGAAVSRLCDLAIALNCKIYDLIDDEELIQKIKKTL